LLIKLWSIEDTSISCILLFHFVIRSIQSFALCERLSARPSITHAGPPGNRPHAPGRPGTLALNSLGADHDRGEAAL